MLYLILFNIIYVICCIRLKTGRKEERDTENLYGKNVAFYGGRSAASISLQFQLRLVCNGLNLKKTRRQMKAKIRIQKFQNQFLILFLTYNCRKYWIGLKLRSLGFNILQISDFAEHIAGSKSKVYPLLQRTFDNK